MSARRFRFVAIVPRALGAILVCVLAVHAVRSVEGQIIGGGIFQRNAIGGVRIDPQGVLVVLERKQVEEIRQLRLRALKGVPEGLQQDTEIRKISLKQLQKAILASGKNQTSELPDAIRYLGGLQRVQYVFVYPEQNDVVLAGPGEAWKIDAGGNVVGKTTGRPVLHLDDLIVALRTTSGAERGVMSCSIDPTPEGMLRLQKTLAKLRAGRPINSLGQVKYAMRLVEEAVGQQHVDIRGVDESSRFARVLVAADYRMKRLAMGHDKAPIAGLPSFLSLIKSVRNKNMMPRWWLEDNYQALLTDGAGLAWELRGTGVKAMSEDEVLAADGTRKGTGKIDPISKKWADAMTDKYEELAGKEVIFGELRNCMDLAVISALMVTEDLHGKAGLDLGVLLGETSLATQRYKPAKRIPTIASSKKVRSYWAITSSGGVQIDPWRVAQKREKSKALATTRQNAAAPKGATWFWN